MSALSTKGSVRTVSIDSFQILLKSLLTLTHKSSSAEEISFITEHTSIVRQLSKQVTCESEALNEFIRLLEAKADGSLAVSCGRWHH